MIAALVRRDQPVRLLWLTVPMAVVAGIFAAQVYGENSTHRIISTEIIDPIDRMVMITQLTLTLGAGLIPVCLVHLRALPLHLGLPLSTRVLWTARMIAICLGIMVPIGAGLVTYFVLNRNPLGSPHVEMGLNFAAVFLVAPFLYQFRHTASNRVDLTWCVLHWLGFSALVVAAEILVAYHRPPFAVVGPTCLGLAAALAAITYRWLPASFEVVRRRPWFSVGDGWSFRLPRVLEVPILSPLAPLNRAMRLNWLLTANVISLVGSTLAFVHVATSMGKHVELFMVAVFQVLLFALNLIGLPMVMHLPISKARLFAQCAGPGLLLAAIAAAIALRADQQLALADVFASRTAAVGFTVYVAIHFLCCAACLVPLMTPSATARGRRLAWTGRILLLLAAMGAFGLAVSPAFESMEAAERGTNEVYGRIAEWIAIPALAAWVVAGALAVASAVGVYALFARIELTWLRSRLQKWYEKFA